MQMDDVDREIIDGRTTFRELGKITGYTSMGVKKRVSNLLKEKAIRISAQLNLKHFGSYAAIALVETDGPETMRRLLERFRDCLHVVYIFSTVGGSNIIAIDRVELQRSINPKERFLNLGEGFPIEKDRYVSPPERSRS